MLESSRLSLSSSMRKGRGILWLMLQSLGFVRLMLES